MLCSGHYKSRCHRKKKSLIPPEGVKESDGDLSLPVTPTIEPKKAAASLKPQADLTPVPATGSRTISIKPENHTSKPKQDGAIGPLAENVVQNEFSQEKLEKVWIYYTESIAGQYPNFYSILSTRKPLLKENFVIELKLDNRAQEMTFKERRADLLDFLRAELRNQKIQMETILVEIIGQSKPYTAEDKYRAMVEKNPELKTLRESLDLELEL